MDEEVVKVVAETTAQIAAGKSKSEQKVSMGGDLIESQVRDNEIQSVANKVADGTAGQALISDKVEGLKSWQIYWDVTTKAYVINDPRIVTPMGTMVIQSVAIEANKTYTAQVWLNSEGVWNAAIVTAVQPKSGAVSETNVQIAVVGDLTGPNQIKQRHVGAIIVSASAGNPVVLDDVSVGKSSEGKVEIKDFSSGPEEGYTLAEKLSEEESSGEEERYSGQVLVRIPGSGEGEGHRLVYVPVGRGLGGGGGKITIQGTDGTEAKGNKIVFEAEDDTNITFKASANNGTVTVKVGVYYRR